jgi:hypothetical protein
MPSCGHGSQTPGVGLMINPQNSRNVAPNIRLQRKMLSEVRWLTKPITQLTYSSSSASHPAIDRGKFNCAGQRARLRTRGPEAPRPKVQ